MEHGRSAVEVARLTGWDIDGLAADMGWEAVNIGPVGQHRDSDALARSNWQVVYGDLSDRFPGQVTSVSLGHWGHGWVEELAYNAGNADVVAAVERWERALSDYPVADEMHYSQVEWDENHPTEDECYGGDDCGCRSE